MPLIPIIPPNGPELWSPQSPTIVDQIQDKVWDKGSLFLAKVGPRQTLGGAGPRLPFKALRFQRWSPACSLTPLSCRQKPSGMLLGNGLTSWPSPSPSPRVSFPHFPSIPNESGYFQPLSLSIPAPQSLVLKQGAGRGGGRQRNRLKKKTGVVGRAQLSPVSLPCQYGTLASQALTSPLLGSDPGAVGQHQEWVGHLKTQEQVLKASSKMPEASSEAPCCEADPAHTTEARGV